MIIHPVLSICVCFQLITRLVERIIHVSFLSQIVSPCFTFLDHALSPFTRFEIDDIAENHFRERSKHEIYRHDPTPGFHTIDHTFFRRVGIHSVEYIRFLNIVIGNHLDDTRNE